MLSTTKTKLQYQYLFAAILIVMVVLATTAYRSGAVDRLFYESRQVPAVVIYGPPGR